MRTLEIDDTGFSAAEPGEYWTAGASRGYRPYWTALPPDMRYWTCWDRSSGELEMWPAVMDDFGNLRGAKASQILFARAG